jgi:multimeric flavodoxin WrbA
VAEETDRLAIGGKMTAYARHHPELHAQVIPTTSNTEALATVVADALRTRDVTVDMLRVVDHNVPPGVESDLGDDDGWPAIRQQIIDADILVIASPTWLGQPSSVAKRVLERMDAMLSEQDDEGRPIAYNHVAGVVCTGNEDGAHHVISEISGALVDIGQNALTSRIAIEQAKGVLAERHGLTVDQAFDALRQYARRNGRRIHDVAESILDGDLDLTPGLLPRPPGDRPRPT